MSESNPSSRPVVEFDHHSPHQAEHSHEVYRELRSRCPVAWTQAHGGYWVVSTYEGMSTVSRDDKLFSSYNDLGKGPRGGITLPNPNPVRSGMIETDPPRFSKIRRAVNEYFSPKAVERIRGEVREYATWSIDRFIARGEGDLVTELASPVPALLTVRMLGLPLSDWKFYSDAMHRGVYVPPDSPERPEVDAVCGWTAEQIREKTIERRERPGDDLISFFATLKIDGEYMPIDEALGNSYLVLTGGVDTTTSLLANTFLHLHQDRAARRWLMEDRTRLDTACEEYLRYFTPVQGLARTVTERCTLQGQVLDKDERVWISWASANLDPAKFDDPETIRLDRFPNHHAAFGLGRHRCLGSTVARVVWSTVVNEVLDRLPDYEVDTARAERYTSIGIVNGWATLPVRFSPGAARGTSLNV